MKPFRTILLFLILVSLPILACSALGGEEPTPTPAPTSTPAEPTSTPVPPTETPVPTPEIALGDSFEDEASGIAFDYPEGWAVSNIAGFISVASSDDLLNDPDGASEGAVLLIIAGDLSEFEGDGTEPIEILESAIDHFQIAEDTTITDGPRDTTVNGQDAATAEVRGTTDDGTPLVATATLIVVDDRIAFVFAATPEDLEEDFMPILNAIVQTVRVSEPVVTTPEIQGTVLYGESVEGFVTADTPAAWSFVGFEGETVDIVVQPATDSFDLVVDVLDETGSSILDGGPVDSSFGAEEISGLTLPATGEYLVVVTGFGGSTGEFTLTVTESGGAGPVGPGAPIVIGESISASVAANEGADYLFAAVGGDSVTIRVTPQGSFDLVVEIYDPNGDLLQSADSSFGEEVVSFTFPSPGLYAIRVVGFNGAAGSYTIGLDGATGEGIQIVASDDLEENGEHFFPFTASASATASIVVVPVGDFDVVVEVYNADTDEMLAEVDQSFGAEQLDFVVPAAGDYYFRVTGFDGAAGAYDVTMSGPPEVNFELALGDDLTGSIPAGGQIDLTYFADVGDTFTISVLPDSNLDVVIEVLNFADDNLVADADLTLAGEAEELTYTAATEGLFIIRIRGFAGASGTFTMTFD